MLVTLLADVAANYSLLRTYQQRLQYARENVALQRTTLNIVDAGFRAGTISMLDLLQSRSTLSQTEAQVPELELGCGRLATELCILLGMPPVELQDRLGCRSDPQDAGRCRQSVFLPIC